MVKMQHLHTVIGALCGHGSPVLPPQSSTHLRTDQEIEETGSGRGGGPVSGVSVSVCKHRTHAERSGKLDCLFGEDARAVNQFPLGVGCRFITQRVKNVRWIGLGHETLLSVSDVARSARRIGALGRAPFQLSQRGETMPQNKTLEWQYTGTRPLKEKIGVFIFRGVEAREEGVWDRTLYVGWGRLDKEVGEIAGHADVATVLHRNGEVFWAWAEVAPDEARFVAYALAKRVQPYIPCPARMAASPATEIAVNLPDCEAMPPLFNKMSVTSNVGAPSFTAHAFPAYPPLTLGQMCKQGWSAIAHSKLIIWIIQKVAEWVR